MNINVKASGKIAKTVNGEIFRGIFKGISFKNI